MISIKNILSLVLMIAFTFNATVGFTAGICGCNHPDSQVMEMPCHDGEHADQDHVASDDDNQEQETAKCTMCKCGHCKSHSQMSLGHISSPTGVQATQSSVSVHMDVATSSIIYGIDNPPKPIS